MSYIPWYITLTRLIIPFSVLRFPLLGILAAMFADGADWIIIGVTSLKMDAAYQNWDKAMDLYSFLFIVLVVWAWQDIWAKRMALGLFGYRVIGDILFWITKWRPIFLFFPNVFENFVVLCLIIFWWSKARKLNLDRTQKAVMLGILIIPKMFQEYFQHYLGLQPWEIFSFCSWLGIKGTVVIYLDPLLWVVLLYAIPMAGYLLYIRKNMRLTSKK